VLVGILFSLLVNAATVPTNSIIVKTFDDFERKKTTSKGGKS
jgi:hypothetical protein